MKKLLALLLCMAMTLSLSACSGDFWYPLNLLFENKATVEQAEPSEDAGDVEEEDAKETADKPDEREEDATEVEKEEQEKKKEESKKETSNKQVNNRERTGKYKVSYSTTEEDYHSFDIEHLDLVDDLEDDLEMLKTKKDTKEYIRTHIGSMTSLEANGEYWADDEDKNSIACYYETDRGQFNLNRTDDGDCTILDYRYHFEDNKEFDKAYSEFCTIILNYFNVDLREIKELEEVVKDTVTNKSKQKSVMITIDGFECESWLDISCGVSSYNEKGFLSYTFYAEHIED